MFGWTGSSAHSFEAAVRLTLRYHQPMQNRAKSPLDGIRVLDGGLATELERRGATITGPLWSAHVLEDQPEILAAVHRAYLEAGAEIIATGSYQVSRHGYREVGLSFEQADRALLRSVRIAREATAAVAERPVLVAASLGPWGAVLHNGAEYTGDYDCSFTHLVDFHRQRVEVLVKEQPEQRPDLLAFETFPSIEEARAVLVALEGLPQIPFWLSFSCRDERHTSHGEPVREAAALVAQHPQAVGVGVNCVPSQWVMPLIAALSAEVTLPVMVYPNSGEGWDARNHCWKGASAIEDFGSLASAWFAAGASIVGGCCRIGPEHIAQVAAVAQGLRQGWQPRQP